LIAGALNMVLMGRINMSEDIDGTTRMFYAKASWSR
jgi:hypothetical protein